MASSVSDDSRVSASSERQCLGGFASSLCTCQEIRIAPHQTIERDELSEPPDILVGIATCKAHCHPREHFYVRDAIDTNHGMGLEKNDPLALPRATSFIPAATPAGSHDPIS